ncbi:hypothetical protein [Tateyamaria pelophila]|uniref:hypothetical protein n=1 Tax=Tateyamaria pelophila TaxID=328415 RepID=UPI001CBBE7AD|nr:hypothetical protein [Tateyamaria pelophila]
MNVILHLSLFIPAVLLGTSSALAADLVEIRGININSHPKEVLAELGGDCVIPTQTKKSVFGVETNAYVCSDFQSVFATDDVVYAFSVKCATTPVCSDSEDLEDAYSKVEQAFALTFNEKLGEAGFKKCGDAPTGEEICITDATILGQGFGVAVTRGSVPLPQLPIEDEQQASNDLEEWVAASPFGVSEGSLVTNLDATEALGRERYSFTPQKPHSQFSNYSVVAPEGVGV